MNSKKQSFRKGDRVLILPEFQDEGDGELIWQVVADEEKGRVDISPVSIKLQLKPRYTVKAEWITLINS
jgi:hypothetical protein